MKTNGQWYLQLPEPHRLQALNNAEREGMLGNEVKSLGASLCAFPWDMTPQGHDYRQAIFDKIQAGVLPRS